ncbi:hypothetical protein [Bacillus sp. GB_SG_008]
MRPIGSTNHQWGMKKTPLMEVSLYQYGQDSNNSYENSEFKR